ncbi:response regulator transcription factor [Kitasatospora sp. NBC_01250]|uniref:response regulator transcription factor n=1 Tax=unclassified Kitasatospora TaxID=2633591 RepID=UPI002E0E3331|nr:MULTISPECIES: response regulator transcription factor [unclassified Kitasatospora]WSJ64964.1 response regulator transcription factor [Kitasatospora sp. NBC_01302]
MTDRLLRVVLAEDSVILRDGMVELLNARGCQVVATAGTAEELLAAAADRRPDVAVVDVRMPPTYTDEGIRAAVELRAARPGLGVLVFSQHVETVWAQRLLEGSAAGVGYLLKERIARTSELVEALHRVAAGGTALDPEIVTRLIRGGRRRSRIESLTPRERETLELMAQGHSNRSIAARLVVSERAVEKHVAAIFVKFDLPAREAENRRVKVVLAYLAEAGSAPPAH